MQRSQAAESVPVHETGAVAGTGIEGATETCGGVAGSGGEMIEEGGVTMIEGGGGTMTAVTMEGD